MAQYSHLGLAISRPLPLLLILLVPCGLCVLRLLNLLWRKELDTIPMFKEDRDGNYVVLQIRCFVAHEDHASWVISRMAKSLLIFETVQLFAQAVLISQKRWARTAKTLSILLIAATLACVIAITIKARNLMSVLRGPGPLPEYEEYCSEFRASISSHYDIRNTSDNSGVRPAVIACTVDCVLKVFLILFLFVLPTSIKISVPFEPMVTGPKSRSTAESDVNFPETGPISEAWKNAHRRSLSRSHVSKYNARQVLVAISTLTNVRFNQTRAPTLSVENNACPSWVLSNRLTRVCT